ncbi:class I SAM-dependent methyltransferase [Ramlibacter sp. MMS24-I3-19]|uniref:class I SAM-dependent methyltransferase n=1 Tax=Ramlibacter sp. MMS24-I3-19 TaxID=3416606 RepID=UPI003D06348D
MNKTEFFEVCTTCVPQASRQGGDYLDEHRMRLWSTFKVCEELLQPGDSIISVGAGSAYVEHALHRAKKVQVTVVDFPEAIQAHAKEYARSEFRTVAADLTRPLDIPPRFDLALSCEIIEHIPRDPQLHISLLAGFLAPASPRGYMVVTTPNFGNVRNIVKLAMMRPIMPPASRVFGDVCYENEGVHRREYLPSEIISCMDKAGLRHIHTYYTENEEAHSLKNRVGSVASKIAGRFAQTMIVVGRRKSVAEGAAGR